MNLMEFPYYCGGRILKGFHNAFVSDDEVINYSLNYHADIHIGHNKPLLEFYKYSPSDTLKFQQLLKYMIYGSNRGEDRQIGVIFAITNSAQRKATENLVKTGFKKQGSYEKIPYMKVSVDSPTVYIGDFHNDVTPILEKIPSLDIEEVRSSIHKQVAPVFSIGTLT